jgi:hypothetical protein
MRHDAVVQELEMSMIQDHIQTRKEAEIESTTAHFLAYVLRHDLPLSADLRVRESDAALLLGINPQYLKTLRLAGNGPLSYFTGVAGSRYSYRLSDLATWIEMTRATPRC